MNGKHQSAMVMGILFGLVTALIWGSWPVFTRFSVGRTMNPYDITALRFGVSGILLLPYLWRKSWRSIPPGLILLMVCGAGAPYVVVSVWGLSLAPAGHFGVITPSCMLTFSSLGAWLIYGDRPGTRRLIGWGVIITGVVLLGLRGLSMGQDGVWLGDLIFAACGLLWGCYTLAFKHCEISALHGAALVSVVSMVGYLPVYWFFGLGNMAAASPMEIVTQGLFQGVAVAVVALLCFNQAIAILGVSRGSLFGALVPGVALLLAIPVLGELPGSIEWAGLLLVTLGMVLSLGGRT